MAAGAALFVLSLAINVVPLGGQGNPALDGAGGSSSSVVAVNEGGSPSARMSVEAVAATVLPSVVSIEVSGGGQGSTGSGFIVRTDGYLVTNYHVVAVADGAPDGVIKVLLDDDSVVDATIVGSDAEYDVAVLKIGREGLPAAKWADSGTVVVGEPAVALGSPLGLSETVTAGIVSALNRPVTTGAGGDGSAPAFIDAIQTDAAINPGNSGGPLVDGYGKVMGMNSAVATADGGPGSIGVGFAIPSNTVSRLVDEIISTGKAETPIIGVEVKDAASPADGGGVVLVEQVTAGSPAEAAGLAAGDTITKVDGDTVRSAVELVTTIRSFAPGDTVVVTVLRGGEGEPVEVPVVLAAKPAA